MKICVLVKEVPDAAVEKRIDPSTGAWTAAARRTSTRTTRTRSRRRCRSRRAAPSRSTRSSPSRWARETAVRALHKAVSLGADRSVHLSDDALAGSDVAATGYALAQALERETPDLVLLGQQSDDGECYTIGAVVADHLQMPSLTQVIKMDVAEGKLTLRAPGRVRLRHRRGRAARRHLRRRRDQRAALPVAQGDHGREEEAARHASRSATSASTPTGSARTARASQCGDFKAPPQKAAGDDHRGRGHERDGREDRRLARREEADLDGQRHPRLRPALRGRVQQELARRRLRGRAPRRRARRRVPRASCVGGDDLTDDLCGSLGALRRDEGLPRQGPRGPGAAGRRRDGEGHGRRRPPATRCSAAACSASRSAPASPRAWTPA